MRPPWVVNVVIGIVIVIIGRLTSRSLVVVVIGVISKVPALVTGEAECTAVDRQRIIAIAEIN